MPRPGRRTAATAEATATPPRPNTITQAIPPFMLDTPPQFVRTTPQAVPSTNAGQSIVPERNNARRRGQQQTPTANGTQDQDSSQASTNILASEAQNEEQSLIESAQHDVEDAKQLQGLRDISSLATWTLSSAKPGCALPQLRHPSSNYFWQSDGPQPHTLTLHFFKLVAIVKMRIYLDFDLDESYTPTKMKFYAGMSEGGLVEFGSWQVTEVTDPETGETKSSIENVRGWIDVNLQGVGGREARYHEVAEENAMDVDEEERPPGDVLKAMVVQVRICENHQNGKDTHVRGFQVFARDEKAVATGQKRRKKGKISKPEEEDDDDAAEVVPMQPADWMLDPEIR